MLLLGILLSVICGFINTYIAKKKYYSMKELGTLLFWIYIAIIWSLILLAAFNIWKFYIILGYTEGNDFLWNWPFNTAFFGGGKVHYDYTAMIGYEIVIFLSYPLFYKWGSARFAQTFGRRPWQEGTRYITTIPKRPKGSKKGEKVIKSPLCEFKECDDDLERKID